VSSLIRLVEAQSKQAPQFEFHFGHKRPLAPFNCGLNLPEHAFDQQDF
jgi:hypothetical protein